MRIIATLLLVVALFTAASAELLVTANPFGKGRWVVEGAYISETNVSNVSGMSAGTIGAYLGYGLNESLDLIVSGGQAVLSGLPLGISACRNTGLGLNLKYALLNEGKDMPVSVALGGGYKMLSQVTSVVGAGDTTDNGNQILLALGVSKVIVPFIPYAGLDYRTVAYNGSNTQTQIDLSLGSFIAWSLNGAVVVEYTLQSITPNGVSNYTSSQIAGGIAYKI